MRFLALLLAATLPAPSALGAEDGKFPRPIFQTTESLLKDFSVVRDCPERLWPGLSWEKLVVVGIDSKRPLQRGFVMESGERFEIPLDQLPNPGLARSAYGFAEKNGKVWMTLNRDFTKSDPRPHALFELGAHEAFHYVGQLGWTDRKGDRGTKIPVRWEPRYYRYEMQKNLREAFLEPERAAELLGKARYWHERWAKEFPDEAESTTDGYEGSARYVEYLASGIARYGCEVTEEKLRSFVRERLAKEELPDFYFGALDSEGYFAGSVAGYILRWDQPTSGWEKEHRKGATAVDILLAKFPSVADEGSESVRHSFRNYAMMTQDGIDDKLGETQTIVKEKDAVWIALSTSQGAGGGSVRYRGFYIDESLNLRYSVLGQALRWKETLTSDEGLVSISPGGSNPCQTRSRQAVVVRASEVQEAAGTFTVNSAKIRGSFKGEKKLGDGRSWICPEDPDSPKLEKLGP